MVAKMVERGKEAGKVVGRSVNPLLLSLVQALEFTRSAEVALVENGTDASLDGRRAALV